MCGLQNMAVFRETPSLSFVVFSMYNCKSSQNAMSRTAALANLRTTPVGTCLFNEISEASFSMWNIRQSTRLGWKAPPEVLDQNYFLLFPILHWSVTKFCLLEKCFAENGMMSLMWYSPVQANSQSSLGFFSLLAFRQVRMIICSPI